MKVIVTKNLNVRVGAPSVNAPCYQYITPGSEIEVDGKLYKGDLYHDINTWLKDEAGNYYWSGGVLSQSQDELLGLKTTSSVKFNYNQLLDFPEKIKNTKGKNVTIAILDSGCFDHNAIKGAIIDSYDVLTGKQGYHKDESLEGHGTFITGLIAAREGTDSEIVGVAPLVNIIVVRIVEDKSVSAQNVLSGLQWIIKNPIKPDIINMSISFSVGLLQEQFEKVFSHIYDLGILVFAAGQDNKFLFTEDIFYPARNPLVFGVGALNKNLIPVGSNTKINSYIKYIVPDLSFYSTVNFTDDYNNLNGCSFSTAIVCGVVALIISYKRQNSLTQSAREIFDSELAFFEQFNFNESLIIYKNEKITFA